VSARGAAPKEGAGDFFREMIEVAAFGAAFAAIPLFASMKNLQPPWPESVAYISAGVILITALIARQFGPGLISEDLPEALPAVYRRLLDR